MTTRTTPTTTPSTTTASTSTTITTGRTTTAAAIAGLSGREGRVLQVGAGQPDPARGARRRSSGLPYYPVDEDLVFEGLTPRAVHGRRAVDASRSRPRTASSGRPAGPATFTFDLGGAPRRLTAYELEGAHTDGRLFLPFLDATSGTETYGAGRYLDLEPDEDGTYAIDFNLAYHPSCVYAPQFSCPLTPAENRLPGPDRGGRAARRGRPAH